MKRRLSNNKQQKNPFAQIHLIPSAKKLAKLNQQKQLIKLLVLYSQTNCGH
jgi:hypothetical protein